MNKEQLAKDYASKAAMPMLRDMVSRTVLETKIYGGFLAGFDAANRWIKVTPETMPEVDKAVQIFWHDEDNIEPPFVPEEIFFFKPKHEKQSHDLFRSSKHTAYTSHVTHYRYLDTTPPTDK